MQSKLKISFKREFPLTEVSLFYLPSNLKNISTKVSSIARNKFSNKLKPSMRSSHPVRKIFNNHFLVTSGKFSLITFSKCFCLLRDEWKIFEIAFIASKTFLKPVILVRELTKRFNLWPWRCLYKANILFCNTIPKRPFTFLALSPAPSYPWPLQILTIYFSLP